MFRPLNDQVVVEPLKSGEASRGGVVLPDNARGKYHGLRAMVVAVGPGELTISGTRVPTDLRPGDVVVLRQGGLLLAEGGRIYSIVQARDVLAVVEGGMGAARRYEPGEYGGG